MCGIVGMVGPRASDPAAAKERTLRMLDAVRHRGPDGSGFWAESGVALGHRRLSIIDLSPMAAQPMHDPSGRYVVVYNGEIYNYRELRRELERKGHHFQTTSDSEVLLHAYIEWGPQCLDRFNGMWAFAIWDRARRTLFAARDRVGKKPFYYTQDDTGTWYFASEIKAFRAVGFRFGCDPQAAFDFLTQGTYGHLGSRGFLTGVRQLPAAHRLRLDSAAGVVRVERYWQLPHVRERDRLPYDAAFRRRFRELLADAVALRLRSDVPVGATLSGGLDSSAVVLLMDAQRECGPLHLFTSLYPGSAHDETPFFEAVVARLKEPVIHRVTPDREEWRELLLAVLDHQEEPFGDTSILVHFCLMRAARSAGIPVILSGQGGDELLLGYPSMVCAYLGHLLGTARFARLGRELRALTPLGGTGDWLALGRSTILHAIPLRLRDRLRRTYVRRRARLVSPGLRRLVILQRFERRNDRGDLDSYVAQVFDRFALPHLLHYDDRNAMAFGVEGRMPFLDYRLVELLFTADYRALFGKGHTKLVLRESLADTLPPLVAARRDKVGFYTPLAAWLRTHIDWIGSFMSEERLAEVSILDPREYRARLNTFKAGDDRVQLDIWRGLVFHLWLERMDVEPLAIRDTVPRHGRRPHGVRPART
jgi:asparagine synthase (glutamine-hydrolysing)